MSETRRIQDAPRRDTASRPSLAPGQRQPGSIRSPAHIPRGLSSCKIRRRALRPGQLSRRHRLPGHPLGWAPSTWPQFQSQIIRSSEKIGVSLRNCQACFNGISQISPRVQPHKATPTPESTIPRSHSHRDLGDSRTRSTNRFARARSPRTALSRRSTQAYPIRCLIFFARHPCLRSVETLRPGPTATNREEGTVWVRRRSPLLLAK